jgi:hypothetical protein
MNREKFFALATEAVDKLDVNQARREVEPFSNKRRDCQLQ